MIRLSNNIYQQSSNSQLIIQKIQTEVGRKLYVPLQVSFMNTTPRRITSMVDSGSDISICQLEYFTKLFPEYSEDQLLKNLEKTEFTLTSYTNHRICIKGLATFNVKISPDAPSQPMDIFIVDSNNRKRNKSPVILSLAALSKFNININFTNIDGRPTPRLLKGNDEDSRELPSYYQTDAQLSIAHGYVDSLQPKESQHIYFVLPPSSPYLPGDFLIITQDFIPYEDQKKIRIISSTSIVEVVDKEHIVQGFIQNHGHKTFSGIVLGSVDIIDNSFQLNNLSGKDRNHVKLSKISLISECYMSTNSREETKRIILEKTPQDNFEDEQIVDNKLYSLDIRFPEQNEDLSNADAVNNDVTDLNKSLSEERHDIKETSKELSKEELAEFEDPTKTIQLSYKSNPGEITDSDLQPIGISIPSSIMETPADIVKEEDYEPHIWPHVKRIFLGLYPSVISRHSLDRGMLSRTIGFYSVTLKPNVTLPKYKKLYFLDKEGSSMLRDILEFLLKTGVISKAPCSGGDISQFASPCFLVKRANPESAARLVVNFKLINECISVEPIVLNNFSNILNQLQGSVIYSSVDMKNAFNSIELDPASKKLAVFNSQFGCFHWNTLCTGMLTSPNALGRFCDIMLNHVPIYDENGDLKLDDKGYPLMEPDYLDGVCIYYDDILLHTAAGSTHAETLDIHFALVEKIAKRLAFHSCKLEMSKAKFGVFRIQFLGWNISNGYLQADQKRIEKIQQAPFPENVSQCKSYLGLVNCLRHTLHFDILNKMHIMTPLTSTTKKYEPTTKHYEAFAAMNKQLTEAPLYSKVCIPGTAKLMMTDCASERNSSYACVLAQIVPAKSPKQPVEYYLYLEDKGHAIIYDTKTPVRPIPLRKKGQTDLDYRTQLKIKHPPEYAYWTDKTLGYGEDVDNSLGLTMDLTLLVHNCPTPLLEHCKKLNEYIGKSIIKEQLLESEFDGNEHELRRYRQDILRGKLYIDKNLYIIQAMAQSMNRTLRLINTTEFLDGQPIITMPGGEHKPPFFMILYKRDTKFIVRPTLLELHTEYSLGRHRGSLEIILYHSQTIPKSLANNKIMDLELYSLLNSLKAVEKLVGADELLCLVDNKPIYYLFHSDTIESFAKINRWSKKLTSEWPNMKMAFISSKNNLSDWLSRMYQIPKPEISRIHLPDHTSNLLDDYIPENKIWTLEEWKTWVSENPQFLKYVEQPKKNTKKPDYSDNNKTEIKKISQEQSRKTKRKDCKLCIMNRKRIREQIYAAIPRKRNSSSSKPNNNTEDLPIPTQTPSKNTATSYIETWPNSIDNAAVRKKRKSKHNECKKCVMDTPLAIQNKPRIKPQHKTHPKKLSSQQYLGMDEMGICALKLHIKEASIGSEDLEAIVFGSNYSTNMATRNLQGIYNPIRALEDILTKERILDEQQKEYKDIYDKCAINPDKVYEEGTNKYSIELGTLFIEQDGKPPKLMIPTSLLPHYVGQAHLSTNHSSTQKLLLNLCNYYHPKLREYCTKFANSCMACLLVNHSTKTQKLGRFPLDMDCMEVVNMDMMESIGASSGFPHLLVVKCPISNFIITVPMKSKTSKEFIHVFEKVIYQPFHPKAAYTDNGSFFVSDETITALALMGTTVIYSSAFSGASHGGIERYVQFFKNAFRKALSIQPSFNWTGLSSTLTHLHNTTKLNKSGYSPAEIIFGPNNHLSSCVLDAEDRPRIHPAVKNNKQGIEKKFDAMKIVMEDARNKIKGTQDKQINSANKNRITRSLDVGDIILIKDRSKVIGSTKPLKTRFYHAPFILLYDMPSTSIIRRIRDSWITGRHKDDIKKYIPFAPEFEELPDIVKKICEQTVHKLTEEDLAELLRVDNTSFEDFDAHRGDIIDDKEFTEFFDQHKDIVPPTEEELKDRLLNQDEDDEEGPMPGMTRQGMTDKIDKILQFDANTKPE